MAGVPWHAAEGYVARLVRAGRRVAICDQVEDAKLAKGLVERRVTELVSPGTAIHGNLVEERANTFLAAASPGPGGCGEWRWPTRRPASSSPANSPNRRSPTSSWGFRWPSSSFPRASCPPRRSSPASRERARRRLSPRVPGPSFDPGRAAARLAAHFGTVALDGFDVADLEPGIGAAGALLEYLTEMRMSPLRHLIAHPATPGAERAHGRREHAHASRRAAAARREPARHPPWGPRFDAHGDGRPPPPPVARAPERRSRSHRPAAPRGGGPRRRRSRAHPTARRPALDRRSGAARKPHRIRPRGRARAPGGGRFDAPRPRARARAGGGARPERSGGRAIPG